MSFLTIGLNFMGFFLFFQYIFPPLHLINDPNRKEKEKKLTHIVNIQNMSFEQKAKMFSIMLLGILLMNLSTAIKLIK